MVRSFLFEIRNKLNPLVSTVTKIKKHFQRSVVVMTTGFFQSRTPPSTKWWRAAEGGVRYQKYGTWRHHLQIQCDREMAVHAWPKRNGTTWSDLSSRWTSSGILFRRTSTRINIYTGGKMGSSARIPHWVTGSDTHFTSFYRSNYPHKASDWMALPISS